MCSHFSQVICGRLHAYISDGSVILSLHSARRVLETSFFHVNNIMWCTLEFTDFLMLRYVEVNLTEVCECDMEGTARVDVYDAFSHHACMVFFTFPR